jgi:hypothetical protein
VTDVESCTTLSARTEFLLTAGLLATVFFASACAAAGTGLPASTPSGSPSASGSAVPTSSPSTRGGELVIVADDGNGGTVRWRLTCDPPAGDHPDAASACDVLDRNGPRALPPVAKNKLCSQVYSGPEKATVTGTWRGRPINATFSRNNSCETARWAALIPLLPKPGLR